MAQEEIVKVIKIDGSQATQSLNDIKTSTEGAGQSFKSLGEYKKHIDSLKASLVDLDSTSDDYKKVCTEIQSAQDKLNQIMVDSKTQADAADGSYNALTKQMSELKKEWRATADEAERAALGKKINSINEQLKEQDASIGNFQRNVGNYEAAFIGALGTVSEGLDQIIPGTMKVTEGFTKIKAALNAVKAAATSNPLTAILTVAASILAVIVANWQKISEWIGISKDNTEEYNRKLEESKRKISEMNSEWEYQAKLLAAQGKSSLEIAEAEYKAKYKIHDAARSEYLREVERNKTLSKKQKQQNEEHLKGLKDQFTTAEKSFNLAKQDLEIAKVRAETQARIAEETKKISSGSSTTNAEKAIGVWEELDKIVSKGNEKASKWANDLLTGPYITAEKLIKGILKWDPEVGKNAETFAKLWSEAIDGEIKEVLPEGIKNAMASGMDEESGRIAAEDYIKGVFNGFIAKAKELNLGSEMIAGLSDQMKDALKGIQPETKAAKAKTDPDKAKEVSGKLKAIDEEYAYQLAINDRKIQSQKDHNDETIRLDRERLQKKKELLEEEIKLQTGSDGTLTELGKQLTVQLNQTNKEMEDSALNGFQNIQKGAGDLVSSYGQLADGLGNLLSEVSSLISDSIAQRVESGEITEKQAKEEYKKVQAIEISTAIITGLQGAATAFATAFQLGPIAGPIVGAANAALVAATTAIQVAKIKQTNPYSKSSATVSPNGTSGTNYTSAYDFSKQETAVQNGTTASTKETAGDTKVYILENDLQKSGNRVQVREDNTTF